MTTSVKDPAAIAPGAPDWATLAAAARTCTACGELTASRTQVVVGDVPPEFFDGTLGGAAGEPLLAVVGEAPGAQEDRDGRPFVGRSGQLLDRLLTDAGLPRDRIAVLNTVKCRPPGNRTPKPAERELCRPWLTRQFELLQPALVIALGSTATLALLGRRTTLGEVRGRVHPVGGVRVVPTYHPSAAIRFGLNGAPLGALRADLAFVAAELTAAGEGSRP